MRESAVAALSIIKSRAKGFKIDPKELSNMDIHVHVPAGAVPKDGPSAGVAMITALSSLLTRRNVRADVAMTGEITLRGLVLPIGGVKEKVLAAKSAGIRKVILPERNRRDLDDVPKDAKEGLQFIFARTIDDVLKAALEQGKAKRAAKPRRKGQDKPRGDRLAARSQRQ
jgi:ATP-dependent Lon protease